jgi:hypothetical protein
MLEFAKEVSTAVMKLVSRPMSLAFKMLVKARLEASRSEANS